MMRFFTCKKRQVLCLLPFLFLILGCTQEKESTQEGSVEQTLEIQPKSAFTEIEWPELMPLEDLQALMTPPEYLSEIPDGSELDTLEGQFPDMSAMNSEDPYQQALVSTKVRPEMDGQYIRLPGFIVPLAFGENQIVTQFFLVPFFGACLHVPPPPPNQILFVDYPKGIEQDDLTDAFWVYGRLKTTLQQNEVATSAYALELHHLELYSE